MKTKKLLIIMMCLVLIGGVLAACSSNNNTTDNNDSGTTAEPSNSGDLNNSTADSEPVELRIAYSDHGLAYVNASTDISNDQYVQALEEMTNTKLEFDMLAHQDYNQSLTLLFAGGDLPDLIHTNGIDKSEVSPAINAGALTPLNDLIDEHAPNMKAYIPQEAWESGQVSKDGVIYAIPQLRSLPNRFVTYVRQDWADHLDIELPTLDNKFTVEQHIEMLKQFRDGAPEDNPIPFTGRENLRYATSFFGAYDVVPEHWRLVEGQLLPNIIRPEMKDALRTYRTLYEEGLMDNEVFVNNGDDWSAKINAGRVGTFVHGAESADNWHLRTRDMSGNPDLDFIAIPSPVGPDGKGGNGMYSVIGGNKFVIPASSDKAVEAIKFLDRFYEQDVNDLIVWGIEGVDHEVVDDKIVYEYSAGNEEISNRERMHVHWLNLVGPSYEFNEEFMGGRPEGERINHAVRIAQDEGRVNDGADMIVPPTQATRPELAWDGTFIEVAAGIITGRQSLDAFDDFVETWKSQGGEEVIEEATEWYNSK